MRFTRPVGLFLFVYLCVNPGSAASQTPPLPDSTRKDTARKIVMPRPPADTDSTRRTSPFGPDLPVEFNARIETKKRRDQNLRCDATQSLSVFSGCSSRFLGMETDLQFAIKSSGTVGERLHVDFDFNNKREFDASNVLSLRYEGPADAKVQKVELGNVAFSAPPSRFLTATVPAGNYGVQAVFQLGALSLRTIYARQSGTVRQRHEFNVGARTLQPSDQYLEDHEVERLRFFFTVDPTLFRGYPAVDILDRARMASLNASLPDTLRPTRVVLYRLQFGTQPQNTSGPKLRVAGDPTQGRQTYDVLREGVDYYIDRSLLWLALVRPLNRANERLLVAYNVRINGRDTVWTTTGGTPDLRATTRDQVANLVMEPGIGPSSPAFNREIRSAYRLAGEDLVRETLALSVITGSGEQERPVAGGANTYLQMLGLAQVTNGARFDVENRVWPRRSDAVFTLGAGAADIRTVGAAEGAPLSPTSDPLDALRIVRDYFVVFPSLQPFTPRAAGGLLEQGNPTNEAIYTVPTDYLYSPLRPASIYRLHFTYQTSGIDPAGVLSVGSVQVRHGSENVVVEGRTLVRGSDYTMNYDLGTVTFTRPDTLFPRSRRVDVSYEENPSGLEPNPTQLTGFVSELPVPHGLLSFTAIHQLQQTPFNRPQLGFQGAASLMTGLTGRFSWNAPLLDRLAARLPGSLLTSSATSTRSRVQLHTELAASRPQLGLGGDGQAYVADFDQEAAYSVPLAEQSWYYSSLPAYGRALRSRFGPGFFEAPRAAALAWQNFPRADSGQRVTFTIADIDSLARFAGSGLLTNLPVLWLTLHPLHDAGRFNPVTHAAEWTVQNAPSGQRFRSVRTVLNAAGFDFTQQEFVQFWALVDTSLAGRRKNPTLVLDFGDISENSVAFAPETLTVRHNTNGTVDSLFAGKRLQGFDRLDSERDSLSRAFNADTNDIGLPGDLIDNLIVKDGASVTRATNVPLCRGSLGSLYFLGDTRANCTRRNNHLDEEDIDLDNAMNFPSLLRESERVLRHVVDLADATTYSRIGRTYTDTVTVNGLRVPRTRQWVFVRTPFRAATDTLNDVDLRRIKAVRLTIVSGLGLADNERTEVPIADLRVTGAPWLRRADATIPGIGSKQPNGGSVVTSTIGTNDSTAVLVYQPPPGIVDATGTKLGQLELARSQINERSLRIQAVSLSVYHRAETFFRFPTGPQNYTGYGELRLWARGRNAGWGANGDLQMFVKLGRDENNFYAYRAPVNSGATSDAWTPEIRVDFDRLYALRARVRDAYLAGKTELNECHGADSALVVASPLPVGSASRRFAACDGGYMIYTVDPAITPPNLAAVQELSVGIVRVGAGGGSGSPPINVADTLELWVDDIRLDRPVNTTGYAGMVGVNALIGDVADLQLSVSKRDPHFRQLGDQPSYLGERTIDLSSTVRLEKFLPPAANLSVPLIVTRSSSHSDPHFLSRTDVEASGVTGLRVPRNDLTTVTLSVRRTAPVANSRFGPLLNNAAATTSWVSGVTQNEYQSAKANHLTVGLDYVVTEDSARTTRLPEWVDRVLGIMPDALEQGPVQAIRGSVFRWNPTQFRINSAVVRGSDRRSSFLKPADAFDDAARISDASTRLWRSGSMLELRPTSGLIARWEIESARDLRDYGDTTTAAIVTSAERRRIVGINAGFERERTMLGSFSFSPVFSDWLRPRTELGTQYNMLRDPNARSLAQLPGVIGVDSILLARDSMALSSRFTLPRRVTGAQTASAGLTLDLGKLITGRSTDSTFPHHLGAMLAPMDLSYTRSLLASLDAAGAAPPLAFQLGLGGPSSFRRVGGELATTSGYTGTGNVSTSLLLPFGTSFLNRYRHTTTRNWVQRLDDTEAQVDGEQTVFPDVALQWSTRPPALASWISNVGASIGYAHTAVDITLPSIASDDVPPEFRRTHLRTFPVRASVNWVPGGLRTTATYSLVRRLDSLPGSVSRSRNDDVSLDLGRAFAVPASWNLKSPLRTRFGIQQTHGQTFILDANGDIASRLQDNGRQAFNLSADADLNQDVVFTLQGSRIVTFDNNLNRRFAQTVFSTVLQIRFYGGQAVR